MLKAGWRKKKKWTRPMLAKPNEKWKKLLRILLKEVRSGLHTDTNLPCLYEKWSPLSIQPHFPALWPSSNWPFLPVQHADLLVQWKLSVLLRTYCEPRYVLLLVWFYSSFTKLRCIQALNSYLTEDNIKAQSPNLHSNKVAVLFSKAVYFIKHHYL